MLPEDETRHAAHARSGSRSTSRCGSGCSRVFAWFALNLVRPFIPLLLWSVILTVAFYPVFAWLRARLRRALVARGAGADRLRRRHRRRADDHPAVEPDRIRSRSSRRHVGAGRIDLPPPPKAIVELPMIGDELTDAWQLASSNLEGFLGQYGRRSSASANGRCTRSAGLAGSVILVLAAVVISGFLYGPAPRLDRRGARASPSGWSGARGSAFVDLAGVTIRNVARGVIGVALIQSLLIGFALIVAEVPAAGLLTLAVLVLGILQIGVGARGHPAADLGLGDARHHAGAVPDALHDPGHR